MSFVVYIVCLTLTLHYNTRIHLFVLCIAPILSPTVTYMRMLLIHRTSLKKSSATKLGLANGFQEGAIVLQRGFHM
jgi:hypothetical protein